MRIVDVQGDTIVAIRRRGALEQGPPLVLFDNRRGVLLTGARATLRRLQAEGFDVERLADHAPAVEPKRAGRSKGT